MLNLVIQRTDVKKSKTDLREYRGLELKNGLNVLLISDPDTDISAASLSVAVGSQNDPKDLPGLAHFCEHMLFMGSSKKYPKENEFLQFIEQNGGYHNAHTGIDHTNYCCSSKTDALRPLLERFSNIFFEPWFTESSAEKETNVINSEHEKNKADDIKRLEQLSRSLADPNHPSNHFDTEEQLATKTIVVPVKDIKKLMIDFLLKDQQPYYNTTPIDYLNALFNKKGPTSLMSALLNNGWSTWMMASYIYVARGIEIHNINIELTEFGLRHIDDIVSVIFQFVNMLKQNEPAQWFYTETKDIKTMEFNFQDKQSPLPYVRALTPRMIKYKLRDVLIAEHLFEDQKPELIKELLTYFTPENMRITVVSKTYQNQTNKIDQYYGTQYSVLKIPEKTLNNWRNIDVGKYFEIPPKNEYIATNLTLVPIEHNEQLGYVVLNYNRRSNGVLYVVIIVQSERHPTFVHTRIEHFLSTVEGLLKDLHETEFNQNKESLSVKLAEKPKGLCEQSAAYMLEITDQCYNFNRAKIEVEELKLITKKDIIDFYNYVNLIIGKNQSHWFKKTQVAVHIKSSKIDMIDKLKSSRNSSEDNKSFAIMNVQKIKDIFEFKKSHRLYPEPKSFIPFETNGIKYQEDQHVSFNEIDHLRRRSE
ncbi:hypothetical protein ACI65C_005236 [Semiaphis heraclei]